VNTTYPTTTVSVIRANNTIGATITLGKDGFIASYDPKNTEMYVSCADSNKTYAINGTTNKVVATITTTQYASGAEYDPALDDMLAAGDSTFINHTSTAKSIVTVIPSSNTGTSTLTLGEGPLGGAVYDTKDLGFFAVNSGTTTVSVVL
jgi:YVTN family beta-propeller protein